MPDAPDRTRLRPSPAAPETRDAALAALRKVDPDLHQLARHRILGRLDDAGLAETTGLEVEEARRRWRRARAFLYREIYGAGVGNLPTPPWAEVAAVFDDLLDHDPPGRVHALARLKEEDPNLRQAVFALLVADAREDGVFDGLETGRDPEASVAASRSRPGAMAARALGLLLVGGAIAVGLAAWRSRSGEEADRDLVRSPETTPPASEQGIAAENPDPVEAPPTDEAATTGGDGEPGHTRAAPPVDDGDDDPVETPGPPDAGVDDTPAPLTAAEDGEEGNDPGEIDDEPSTTGEAGGGSRPDPPAPDPSGTDDAGSSPELAGALERVRSGEDGEALDALGDAIDARAGAVPDDPALAGARLELGARLTDAGRAHQARPHLRRALSGLDDAPPLVRGRAMVIVADNLVALTRYVDADSLYARAARILSSELGADHAETIAARTSLARLRGEDPPVDGR